MDVKSLTIQGYTNLQGSAVIGTTTDFQYYLLDIPELNKTNTNPLVIVFDIMATVVITGSATASYIGKHMSRRINATLLRNAAGEYSVNTSFDTIYTDTEVEKAQTNLEIRDKKLYIKFTGTSYGHTFSCQANVLYTVAYSNFEQQKQITRKTLSSVIEDMAPSSGVVVVHNDTTNRNAADAHPAASITNTPAGTIAATTVQAAINELDGDVSGIAGSITNFQNIINATKEPTGFENRTTSTISYNAGTQVFTINNVGVCYYWIKGVRYTLTGPLSTAAHADTSDTYFFYFNAVNVLTVANSFWDLETVCPIAFVLYDTSGAPQAILCDERHGIAMDWATHAHQHFAKGAFVRSGFAIDDASYVIGSNVAAEKKFQIGDGYLCDEDLTFYHDDALIMEALAVNRRYAMLYRTGVNGDWTWSGSELFPVIWDSITTYNPYYNQDTGATWQLTIIPTNNRWFNVFTCVTNSTDPIYKVVNIIGQTLHTSLAAAQEENILNMDWGDMPFQELAPIYQTTFRRGSYGGAGNPNVRIDAVQKIIGVSITLSGVLASNHASLSGRDLPNSHPATAISYDNSALTGDLFSLDAQNAIEEVGDLINRGAQTGAITRVLGEVTEVEYVRTFGTTVVAITTVGGLVTTVVTTYKNLVDPDIVRTKTLTYDIDGNLISWVTV